jgi:hypothetical protein
MHISSIILNVTSHMHLIAHGKHPVISTTTIALQASHSPRSYLDTLLSDSFQKHFLAR